MAFIDANAIALGNKKATIIALQWVVVIGTAYLSLVGRNWGADDPRVLVLVTALLLSSLVIQKLPESVFAYRHFNSTLLVADTVAILFGIGLNRTAPWDLFFLFFFSLFIAAIAETLFQVVGGCLMMTIIFLAIGVLHGTSETLFDTEQLLKIPFIFGVSLLYGYLVEQVKAEKKKANRLQEIEHLKRQLVSALAHDIKNPLGNILCYADTLGSQLNKKPDNEKPLSAVKGIEENAGQIMKLVKGFLDASKTETGKVEAGVRPVQLNPIIREAGQQHMENLRKHELAMTLDLDDALPEVPVNPDQLERVLWNLIGNAIKFTPPGGNIVLTSRVENGDVCVSVKDSGIGIPEDEIPLLFSEFRRLSGAGVVDGTGLGLFIVKTVVEAHGGTVEARSREGEGSIFTIRFPTVQRAGVSV